MREVIHLATDHGEYDAADWIERAFFGPNKYATKLRSLSQSTLEGEGCHYGGQNR